MAGALGLTLYVLFFWIYGAGAIPAAPCSSSLGLEYVRDDVNTCGYYLCHDGAFKADPSSKNIYRACAPGTSTRNAPVRAVHTPCTASDVICTGRVPHVVYLEPGESTTRGHPTSGTTRMPSTTRGPPPHSTPGGATTTSGYYSVPVEVYQNGHVQGGRHLEAFSLDDGPVTPVTSRRLCHYACDLNATCRGFDWDGHSAACWIHTETTVCGEPIPKVGCEHVRLVSCVLGPSSGPSTDPSSTTYNPYTTLVPPTTTSSIQGFVEKHVGAHVKRGRLVLTKAIEAACLAYCVHFPTCAAVDFDNVTETCWLHTENTACGPAEPKTGCTHYKRQTCDKNGLAPMFLNSFPGYHVQGGTPLCQQCTRTQCQHDCLHHPECAAADYNSLEGACYGHREDTACGILVPKTGCTHFSRAQCQG